MGKQFEELKAALEEALAHAQGKITLRSEKIPMVYKAKDIRKIRDQ